KLYNLRVADYHTYFVGDAHWDFSVWAHNSYNAPNGGRPRSLRRKNGLCDQSIVASLNISKNSLIISGTLTHLTIKGC
ncbi:MAG: hypothetical protein WHU94_16335, partial [Thermogemmata sp.]